MADDSGVSVGFGQLDAIQSFGERPNLVHLDENRIRRAGLDSFLQELRIGDENIVADELDFVANFVGELFPRRPVAFTTAVFDAHDGILCHEFGVKAHEVVAADRFTRALLERVFRVAAVKLGGGRVECEINVLAGLVSGVLDGLNDGLQRLFHAAQFGRESPFVADGGAATLLFQNGFQRVKRFDNRAQPFAERRQTQRHDHEFLEINRCIRVRAAVDDIGHRHGQHLRVRPAEIFEQWQIQRSSGGLGVRK